MNPAFQLGEAVAIDFWWGIHVVIVVGFHSSGDPLVAHCSRRLGRVDVEPLSWIAAGRRVAHRGLASRLAAEEVVRRAMSMRGSAWSFRDWNCEDFVGFALGLPPRSPQREAVHGILSGAATCFAIAGVLATLGRGGRA